MTETQNLEIDPVDQETSASIARIVAAVKAKDEDPEEQTHGLTHEQRKLRRLARRPSIDHLEPGIVSVPGEKDQVTGLIKNDVLPVFNVGDKIVVERFLINDLTEWLDTRVYIVRDIDDETGHVKCIDLEANHHAVVGFKHPGQTFKLCPAKGDPFSGPRVKIVLAQSSGNSPDQTAPSGPKKKGRPKGSKNRPREVVMAEREAKRKERGK